MAALDNALAIVAGDAGLNDSFIPELWSDEVVAEYKKNLVMANLVRKLNHRGKKGDTIYVPRPSRSLATRRPNPGTATDGYTVTLLPYAQQSRITVNIDRHTEYSRLFDDFAQVQALESMRRFFVDDAGYAIAQAVDTDLINEMLAKSFTTLAFDTAGNSLGSFGLIDQDTSVYVANSALQGNGADQAAYTGDAAAYFQITDAAIRAGVRRLDVADVPMMNRVWAVRPEVKEDLIGIPRFTEEAFVGEAGSSNTIRNGLIGDVYGVQVYVTNQLPQLEGSTGDDTVVGQVSLMFHQDSTVLVEQMGMRTQRQYKQEFLSDLLTSDMIYGVKNLREESIIPIFTGATAV